MIKLQYETKIQRFDSETKTITLYTETLEEAKVLKRDLNQGSFNSDKKITLMVRDYNFGENIVSDIMLEDLLWRTNTEYNKDGIKNFILMKQAKKLTDKDFWKIIEDMKWSTDFNYNRIQEEIKSGKFGDKGYMLAIDDKFQTLKKELKIAIDEQLKKQELSYSDVIDKGDDGLDDLCSSIIGFGKKIYTKSLKYPKFAGKQNGTESFSYSFLDY